MQKSRLFSILFTISVCIPFVMQGSEKIPSLKDLCLKKLAQESKTNEHKIVTAITTFQLPRELQAPLFAHTLNVNPNILVHPNMQNTTYSSLVAELSPDKQEAADRSIHKITDRSMRIAAISPTKNFSEWINPRTASRILSQAQILLQIEGLESLFNQGDNKVKKLIIAAAQERISMQRNKHPNNLVFAHNNLEKICKLYSPKRKIADDPIVQLLTEPTTGSPVKKAKRRLNI